MSAEASIARTIQGGFRDKSTRSRRKDDDNLEDTSSTDSIASFGNGGKGKETYVYADQQDKLIVPIQKDQVQVQRSRNQDDDMSFEDADIHRANVKRDVEAYFDGAKRQIMEHVSRGIVYKLVYGTSNKMSEFMVSCYAAYYKKTSNLCNDSHFVFGSCLDYIALSKPTNWLLIVKKTNFRNGERR